MCLMSGLQCMKFVFFLTDKPLQDFNYKTRFFVVMLFEFKQYFYGVECKLPAFYFYGV